MLTWSLLERYQSFGFALISLDNDGTIENCTTAFASILGRDRHDTIGLSIVQITAPEFRQRAKQRIDAARAGHHEHFSAQKAYLLPGGQPVWCTLESVRADDRHLLSAIRKDDQKQQQQELENALRERDEITKQLADVNEKMYALMIAVANQKHAIDVNVIHGGQNNLGKNTIHGDQTQNE